MFLVAQWRRLIWTDPLPNSTMAAGSRKTYALDLNDIFAFPDGNNIPLRPPDTKNGESWVMLLEVGLLFAVSVFFQTLFFVVTWIFILRKDIGRLPFFLRIDICNG
jgi:hypothetical protein